MCFNCKLLLLAIWILIYFGVGWIFGVFEFKEEYDEQDIQNCSNEIVLFSEEVGKIERPMNGIVIWNFVFLCLFNSMNLKEKTSKSLCFNFRNFPQQFGKSWFVFRRTRLKRTLNLCTERQQIHYFVMKEEKNSNKNSNTNRIKLTELY